MENFQTVAECANVTDALIIKGKLESEGIPAYVLDSFLGGSNTFLLTGPKSIRVQVDQESAPLALGIVQAIRNGDFTLDEEFEEQDARPEVKRSLSYLNREDAFLIYAQDPVWIRIWRPLLDHTGYFAGFNPFAALVGMPWFFFRKMYVAGMLVLACDVIALHFVGILSAILLVRIPAGLIANLAYYKKAESVIDDLQAQQLPEVAGTAQLKDRGGISMGSALLGMAAIFLLRIALSMI